MICSSIVATAERESFCQYSCCRSVLKKAAIAYRQNLVLFLEFRWYAIAVFFKNASTSRVKEREISYFRCGRRSQGAIGANLREIDWIDEVAPIAPLLFGPREFLSPTLSIIHHLQYLKPLKRENVAF